MHKPQQASQISNFITYVLHVIFKQESIRLEVPQKTAKRRAVQVSVISAGRQLRVSIDYLRRLWVQLGGLVNPKLRKNSACVMHRECE